MANKTNTTLESTTETTIPIAWDRVTQMTVYTAVGSFGVISSIFVLTVLSRAGGKYRLLALLAVGDLAFSMAFLSAGPIRIKYLLNGVYFRKIHPIQCLLTPWWYCFAFGFVWPQFATMAIAIDRVMAVSNPVWYRQVYAKHFERKFIAGVTAVILLCVAPALLIVVNKGPEVRVDFQCSFKQTVGRDYISFTNTVPLIAGVLGTLLNVHASMKAKKQIREFGGGDGAPDDRERRMNRTVNGIITANLCLVIVPNVFISLQHFGFIGLDLVFRRYMLLLFCLNSGINFYFYLLFNSEFRRLTMESLGFRKEGIRHTSVAPMTHPAHRIQKNSN